MARFANMPEPEYREDREYVRSAGHAQVFDSARYDVKPVEADNIPAIFAGAASPKTRWRLSPLSSP